MILSGHQIRENLGTNILIDPFDEANLNPNSYNLTLHNELITYEEVVLDMAKPNRVRRIIIPPEGLVLGPSQLYLGRTVERTETHKLVPMIEGRSSIGRLGLFVHVTAGFGDVGFCGFWTLEMFASSDAMASAITTMRSRSVIPSSGPSAPRCYTSSTPAWWCRLATSMNGVWPMAEEIPNSMMMSRTDCMQSRPEWTSR